MKTKMLRVLVGSCCLVTAGLVSDVVLDTGFLIREAEARVGRPATPLSVAGVARRTTRRTIRRTSVIVATLPMGCTTVVVEGIALRQCGSTWYQPYGSQWVVVTVN
jgi:hypothetical protein